MDTIERLVENFLPSILIKDKYDQVIQGFEKQLAIQDEEIAEVIQTLEAEVEQARDTSPIFIPEERLTPSLVKSPKLEQKCIPKHLKYIYLEEDETRRLLSKYKEAIGWTLVDLKGISPMVCQ